MSADKPSRHFHQGESHFLFAYGSLQTFSLHPMAQWLHDKAVYINKAFVYGKLFDVGAYPAAIHSDSDVTNKIFGELFHIKNYNIWKTLDEYEDYRPYSPKSSLYLRLIVPSYLFHMNERVFTHFYEYNQSTKDLTWISSGNYEKYLSTN